MLDKLNVRQYNTQILIFYLLMMYVRVCVYLGNVSVIVCVLGMYVCRCVGRGCLAYVYLGICVCVWVGERGCVFLECVGGCVRG